jgi:hypothetical protein
MMFDPPISARVKPALKDCILIADKRYGNADSSP